MLENPCSLAAAERPWAIAATRRRIANAPAPHAIRVRLRLGFADMIDDGIAVSFSSTPCR
jgi:hypothetical protein